VLPSVVCRPGRARGLRRRWVVASYVLAGVFLLGYALIRWWSGRQGSRGPDAAWLWGHLLFLVSQVMVATVLVDLLRRLHRRYPRSPRLVTGVSVLGLVGKYAAIMQTVIDLVVGLRARDRAAMGAMFARVQAVPGVNIAVYQVLPYTFYLGVLVQMFALCWAGAGWGRWWPAALLTLSLAAAVDLDLLPLSAVLLQISFLGLYRTADPTLPPTPAPAKGVPRWSPGVSGSVQGSPSPSPRHRPFSCPPGRGTRRAGGRGGE